LSYADVIVTRGSPGGNTAASAGCAAWNESIAGGAEDFIN